MLENAYGGWIRPVSVRPSAEISLEERRYENGRDPQILDVIDIPMIAPVPRVHQTENHMIDAEKYWTKETVLNWAELPSLVERPASLWLNGTSTYHGTNDCVAQIDAARLASSLYLIRPETLNVQVQTEGGMFGPAKRRVRAGFRYNGTGYNFIVTDPVAEQTFLPRGEGVFPVNDVYLCVSLTEAYERDGEMPQAGSCDHRRTPLVSRPMQQTVFTIGHSTHTLERFIALLKLHDITALGDVRSRPYSRISPQFNREDLKRQLREVGIAYVFLGDELGARSQDPSCYDRGRVQYDRLAQTELFRRGLDRVQEGMKEYRLALMCAEKEPLECHRSVLVARHLSLLGIPVQHILADGRLESHAEVLDRLMRRLALPESDMFRSHEDVLSDAYKIQESRIAYTTAEAEPAAPLQRAAR